MHQSFQPGDAVVFKVGRGTSQGTIKAVKEDKAVITTAKGYEVIRQLSTLQKA